VARVVEADAAVQPAAVVVVARNAAGGGAVEGVLGGVCVCVGVAVVQGRGQRTRQCTAEDEKRSTPPPTPPHPTNPPPAAHPAVLRPPRARQPARRAHRPRRQQPVRRVGGQVALHVGGRDAAGVGGGGEQKGGEGQADGSGAREYVVGGGEGAGEQAEDVHPVERVRCADDEEVQDLGGRRLGG